MDAEWQPNGLAAAKTCFWCKKLGRCGFPANCAQAPALHVATGEDGPWPFCKADLCAGWSGVQVGKI